MSFSKFMVGASASIMFCLLFTTSLFAQNSSISGTVSDPTNALIPGVEVTATNTGTAVTATVLTNDSGAYNFVSLPPGPYKLTATLQGFQTATVTNVSLGTAEVQRFNIVLKLGSAAGTTVDVAVDASTIIAQSSPSIGEALTSDRVRDLPLIGGDVLDLMRTVAGVNGDGGTANFAGIGANSINTVRDGLSVSDGRFVNGVFATTVINPDLVGEIKIILAPVDAEMGRGNGQVIVTTKSGTNQYTGAATLLYTNSGLNPNSWVGNQSGSFKDSNDAACAVQQASDSCKWTLTNKPAWFSNYHPTVSFGGPIIKNKTFFFTLWDQQKNFQRALVTATVLTPTARNGVFRYFDNWTNGNAVANVTNNTVGSTNGVYPVVDLAGNPVTPAFNPGGGAYTGGLKCYSVFGPTKADGTPFTAADCPNGTALGVGGAPWDPARPAMDSTGYIAKILQEMPAPNNYGVNNTGDGLNTAALRYVRGRNGNTGANVTTGADLNTDRWQFNLKIDHNFNAKNKISGGWTKEQNKTASDVPNWPDQIAYTIKRFPQVFTVNFTSTLSSSLLNEARTGIRYENAGVDAPWEDSYPDAATRDRAKTFMMNLSGTAPTIGAGGYFAESPDCGSRACYQTLINPVLFGGGTNGVMVINPGQYNGNQSPLYNFADTFSWTMGRHAFKFGVETNMTKTKGFSNITAGGGISLMYPILQGGAGLVPSPLSNALAGIPNSNGGNRNLATNLELFLAGAIGGTPTANPVVPAATQIYWIDKAEDVATGTWQNVATEADHRKHRTTVINEWNAFMKDDWKATKSLTMNIGLRFDFYGSPFFEEGFTTTPIGQGNGLFGIGAAPNGNVFSNWLAPGNVYLTGYGTNPSGAPLTCALNVTQSALLPTSSCDPAKLTTIEFVGPHTPNPKKSILPNDLNNFGPAVGFSWQVPWFGEGKTTLRGGYQITYGGSGRLVGGGGANSIEGVAGNSPGAISNGATVLSDFPTGTVFNLANANLLVPVRPTNPALPGGQILVYSRSSAISAYAPDSQVPYTQNFTLSLQRNVNRKVQVSLNYVGTIAKHLQTSVNPNLANIYYNKELWDALDLTRQGGESLLLDQMLAGIDLHGTANTTGITYGAVGTFSNVNGVPTLNHASDHLRRNATYNGNLANGNFLAVAQSLNTASNASVGALQPLPIDPSTGLTISNVGGRVLRNGCDRLANGIQFVGSGGTSTTNPLLAVPNRCFPENYISINPQMGNTTTYLATNGKSNYNSIQGQVTVRPLQGVTYQATYAFSKALDLSGNASNPLNYNADYGLTGGDHKHEFRSNGSFELPFGPNKIVLGNSSGIVARLVERWQMNIIYNVTSGGPLTVGASTGMYANFVPDNVGNFDRSGGTVNWNGPAGNGPGGAGTGGPATGTYFGSPNIYSKAPDPQCALGGPVDHTDPFLYNMVTTNGTTVNNNCTLQALSDAQTGKIVLQQSQIGKPGNLGQNTIRGVGNWALDGNIGKTFRITESKSLQVRIDATNIMNHPTPASPIISLGGASDFGSIAQNGNTAAKNGARSFQGQVRFTF